MEVNAYAKLSYTIFSIAAVGIHVSLGGKPPMSHRVIALNSFVLPAHEVDVSHAPMLQLRYNSWEYLTPLLALQWP